MTTNNQKNCFHFLFFNFPRVHWLKGLTNPFIVLLILLTVLVWLIYDRVLFDFLCLLKFFYGVPQGYISIVIDSKLNCLCSCESLLPVCYCQCSKIEINRFLLGHCPDYSGFCIRWLCGSSVEGAGSCTQGGTINRGLWRCLSHWIWKFASFLFYLILKSCNRGTCNKTGAYNVIACVQKFKLISKVPELQKVLYYKLIVAEMIYMTKLI